MTSDHRFGTHEARQQNRAALYDIIAAWTRTQPKSTAAALLQQAGVPAAPVQTGKDLSESEYLKERGLFTVLDHLDAGRHAYQGLPFHLSRTPGRQRNASPCLGADTEMILRDIANLSEAEIDALRRNGALSNTPPA